MTINEQIDYWIKIAEHDIPVAEHLLENEHYIWCLFIVHLIHEKIIKAHYVKDTCKTPSRIYDIVKLSDRTKLNLKKEQIEFLLKVTTM